MLKQIIQTLLVAIAVTVLVGGLKMVAPLLSWWWVAVPLCLWAGLWLLIGLVCCLMAIGAPDEEPDNEWPDPYREDDLGF